MNHHHLHISAQLLAFMIELLNDLLNIPTHNSSRDVEMLALEVAYKYCTRGVEKGAPIV